MFEEIFGFDPPKAKPEKQVAKLPIDNELEYAMVPTGVSADPLIRQLEDDAFTSEIAPLEFVDEHGLTVRRSVAASGATPPTWTPTVRLTEDEFSTFIKTLTAGVRKDAPAPPPTVQVMTRSQLEHGCLCKCSSCKKGDCQHCQSDVKCDVFKRRWGGKATSDLEFMAVATGYSMGHLQKMKSEYERLPDPAYGNRWNKKVDITRQSWAK